MDRFAATVVTLIVMLIGDYVWLSCNKAKYSTLVEKVQKHKLALNIPAGVVAYVFVALAFIVIVVPKLESNRVTVTSLTMACLDGALIGLSIYGIYNATNMAIFSHYDPIVAIMDTLWGTVLFAIAAGCYILLRARTKN